MSYLPMSTQATGSEQELRRVTAAPTEEDWERHRPMIKKLYIDEDKSLQELIQIMKTHGHKASLKMYKTRFTKWRLFKNKNQPDMRAILRLQNQRAASGKKSSFRIRGQDVNIEAVFQYFKRRHESIDGPIEKEAETPSCISCWTPSPISTPRPLPPEEPTAVSEGFIPALETQGTKRRRSSADSDIENGTLAKRRAPAQFHAFDEEAFERTLNELSKLLRAQSGVPNSPLPPTALLVPEKLLLNIKTYFEICFQGDYWLVNKQGKCIGLAPKLTDSLSFCIQFQDYTFSALELVKAGAFIQCRYQLSKACNILSKLLQLQHPRTLDYMINTFVMVYDYGHPEIIALLARHITAVSKAFLPAAHPWTKICQYFVLLDFGTFRLVMVQSWKCGIDTVERNMVDLYQLINMKQRFIQTEARMDLVSQQRQIQELIEFCASIDDNWAARQVLYLSVVLVQNAFSQGRYAEAEKLALEIFEKLNTKEGKQTRFNPLKFDLFYRLGHIQLRLDSREEAEWNMRMAIKTRAELFGSNDPQAIQLMTDFQSFLRNWGRNEEATELMLEIERLIGDDGDDLGWDDSLDMDESTD